MSAASIEEFMRALERVHSGANGALATLAHLAPEVWLVVPVEKAPTPGERVQATGLREEDGRILLSVFSSETSLKRWGLRRLWGTLPALAIFEAALAMPCDAARDGAPDVRAEFRGEFAGDASARDDGDEKTALDRAE